MACTHQGEEPFAAAIRVTVFCEHGYGYTSCDEQQNGLAGVEGHLGLLQPAEIEAHVGQWRREKTRYHEMGKEVSRENIWSPPFYSVLKEGRLKNQGRKATGSKIHGRAVKVTAVAVGCRPLLVWITEVTRRAQPTEFLNPGTSGDGFQLKV
jgi:hypothetical protein